MKPQLFLLTLALSVQFISNAQSGIRYENNSQVGLLSGNTKNAWQLQTINGVRHKTYSFGMGVGIDNYYFKTIPVFADIRKDVFEREQTPFVYIDAGFNFPVKKQESTAWQTTVYQAGFYYDLGFGYKWAIGRNFHLLSSFGFSQKKYGSRQDSHFGTIPEVAPDRYDYRLQRFALKFGLGF